MCRFFIDFICAFNKNVAWAGHHGWNLTIFIFNLLIKFKLLAHNHASGFHIYEKDLCL